MNIAFYVDSIDEEGSDLIFDCMNSLTNADLVRDATLFYNDIGPEPKRSSFGLFNATELWYFTGHVIATTMENWFALKKTVNNFNTKYLYQKFGNNIHILIDIANQSEVIVKTEEEQKEVYRLTGIKPPIVKNLDSQKLLEVLNEHV
jgi:hypothetical protein